MKTTAESTATDDATLRLLLPSALAARVLAYEDELQAAQAAPVDRIAHARAERTEAKQALCNQAITDTLAWLEARGAHVRVAHVLEHLKNNQDIYKYSELPSRRYVKKMLKAQGL